MSNTYIEHLVTGYLIDTPRYEPIPQDVIASIHTLPIEDRENLVIQLNALISNCDAWANHWREIYQTAKEFQIKRIK